MQNTLTKITAPVLTWQFCYFFLLNFISNLAYTRHDNSAWALFAMAAMAGLFAYFETFLVNQLRRCSAILANVATIVMAAVHTIIIVTDYALIILFWKVIDQTVVDILAETNRMQAADFLRTYFGPWGISLVLGVIVLFNAVLYFLSQLYTRLSHRKLLSFLPIAGLGCMVTMVVHLKMYGTALYIPSYVAPTRIAYSSTVLLKHQAEIGKLDILCRQAEAKCQLIEKPDVVLIIGESCSKYHCSLYGYGLETFPLLQQKADSGRLILFSDAVAVADATYGNMRVLFALGDGDDEFAKRPLFPACFKAAGYKTALYDNQYFLGQGVTFLTDKHLSALLWDRRNLDSYKFDGEMIQSFEPFDASGLYIFHLWGQHYDYKNRYPEEKQVFFAKHYDSNRYSEEKRIDIAHYDNACCYNDAVVSCIIEMFSHKNAIIVYVSDHGEEVYETGDFNGHGTSTTTKDWHYQLCVPLMVYVTEKYEAQHKDICDRIRSSAHRRVATKDIAHVLIDVAGIETKDYNPKRDFICQDYDTLKHRVAMGMIDVDK